MGTSLHLFPDTGGASLGFLKNPLGENGGKRGEMAGKHRGSLLPDNAENLKTRLKMFENQTGHQTSTAQHTVRALGHLKSPKPQD